MNRKKVVVWILVLLCVLWIAVGIIVTVELVAAAKESVDTYIDPEYVQYCEVIGRKYGVQPEFLESFIEAESSGNPSATNGNCKGLMQVYEDVHRDRMRSLGVRNLFDPYSNILAGTDILVELFETYGDDTALVVAMYNGQSNAKRRTENFDFDDYTKKVLNRAAELERIRGK